jgi:hypothetical protein
MRMHNVYGAFSGDSANSIVVRRKVGALKIENSQLEGRMAKLKIEITSKLKQKKWYLVKLKRVD